MRVDLPELLWYENSTLELDLPDDWQVEICPMRGAGRLGLSLREMAQAIDEPIGTAPLRELARGKKKAVVIFDDMTRPTRIDQIGPIVIRELVEGGIPEDRISFVCALGTHGALTQNELRKKVGREILERFRVYNHNCYENCVEVGTTSRGTQLKVNREVMSADLKIGVGCVTAHAQVGFSGGGKIVLPGVSHMDSIAHYHIDVQAQAPETTGLGNFDHNVMRFNIEEAARMVGLDFKIDVIVNDRGATTAVFAGDFIEAHARAVEVAKDHYAIEPRPRDKEVMIANAFCKPNEMPIAALVGILGLRELRGSVVIIANSPEGQVIHYLLGRFGQDYGGRQYPIAGIPPSVDLVIQARHLDRTFGDWFADPEVITWTKDWSETRSLLERGHGPGTCVGVVPSATMAYHAPD
jgi:nickel-dependent lactate racemase